MLIVMIAMVTPAFAIQSTVSALGWAGLNRFARRDVQPG